MDSSGQFSRQERKVIDLLLKGKSNKQMAASLGITVRTIEFHLNNVYKKLNVRSRTEAVLKLTEAYPRESTGIGSKANSGISTVAEMVKLTKMGGNKIQLWRQKMPYVFYILVTIALLIILLGVGRLLLEKGNNPFTVAPEPSPAGTSYASATDIPHSGPIALKRPTELPSPSSSPTVVPTASLTAVSSGSTGSTCQGPIPSRPAGPKANLAFVNSTKANITISLFLAKNKFGDCGYSSYVLTRSSSIYLTEVLPYGCYYTYVIVNDPKNPTNLTSGPDCITEPIKTTFTITNNSLKISPSP